MWVPRFLSLAVYRHQLRPVIETGVIAMNTIMNRKGRTQSNLAPGPVRLAPTMRHIFEDLRP